MKIIILIRTSTSRQEVTSQLEETKQFAYSYGFTDNDIIVVGNAGASAIKLDEQYMANINKVFSLIDEGNISDVFAWAIDRIGRNEEVLMHFKNYLIEHKVNLHIKNPNLTLLDANGKVNNGIELAFSLFATMSKQEMENKKARFARARERNKANGVFNGGRVRFGYQLDEAKRYVSDPTTAAVVQWCFQSYADGKYSLSEMAKELQEMGYHYVMETTHQMLICPLYYDGTKYPPIVTKELYDKVQLKLKSNRSELEHQHKYHFFLNRLVKCCCGYGYTVSGRNYRCGNLNNTSVHHSHQMPSGVLDGLAWQIAFELEGDWLMTNRKEGKEKVLQEIALREAKIKGVDTYTEKTEKRRQRAKECVLEGIISMDEYRQRMADIERGEKETAEKVLQWNLEIKNLRSVIDSDKPSIIDRIETIRQDLHSKDEVEMKGIVRKWITKVVVDDDYNVEITTLKRQYKCHLWAKNRSGWKWYTMCGTRLLIPRLERDNGTIKLDYPKGNVDDAIMTSAWLGGSVII